MMPIARRRRIAVFLWVVLAVVIWNGLYDLRISLGVRDYLMQAALHEAGRGPSVSMSDMMRPTVREAVQIATLWASIVLAAGLGTVWMLCQANRAGHTLGAPDGGTSRAAPGA